jgi:hypothetical protein
VNSNAVPAKAMMLAAKGKCFPVIGSLACALAGADVMNLGRGFTIAKISANYAAQCGYTCKIDALCFSHAEPPAFKAETPNQKVRRK